MDNKYNLNFKLKLTTLILLTCGYLTSASAQDSLSTDSTGFSVKNFRTWSVGLNAGMATPHNLLWSNKNNDYSTPREEFAYGLYVKKQFIPAFGLQADFFMGKVTGVRANSTTGIIPGSSFTTRIQASGSLSANITVANFNMKKEYGLVAPFIVVGIGYMYYNPTNVNSGNTVDDELDNYFFPIGAGFKVGLSKGVNLDLGYTMRFMKTDRFDGLDLLNTYDRFSYYHAGIEIALGSRQKQQLSHYNPTAALRKTDDELKLAVANIRNSQVNITNRYDIDLADDDNDGVANKFDKCPGTPAGVRVDGAGCPLPVPTDDDRSILTDVYQNLEFDFDKSTIKPQSFESLDRLAKLLVDKQFALKIAGHADHTGSDKYNLKLSKDRAEAVKAYLVSKGANPTRIEATGYGEFQPIAPNTTTEGRQKNRRVEFTLF